MDQKEATEEKRLKLQDNRMEINRLKNIEKLRKCHLREQKKLMNPKECLKYIKIIIEPKWIEGEHGNNIMPTLTEQKLKYEIRKKFEFGIISWERDNQQLIASEDKIVQLSNKVTMENILLFLLTAEELVASVKSRNLIRTLTNVQTQYTDKSITILIYGLQKYSKEHPKLVNRMDIEMDLTELQIFFNCNHRMIETPTDIATTIVQFTKSVAEKPYKMMEHEKYENFNFFIRNDNKDCVQVEDDIGLKNLWQQHLMKMPLTTLEKAQSIMEIYPTPGDLIKAYSDNSDGQNLLSDVPIRRKSGYTKGRERLGPELSRKIHTFYTTTNPDEALS